MCGTIMSRVTSHQWSYMELIIHESTPNNVQETYTTLRVGSQMGECKEDIHTKRAVVLDSQSDILREVRNSPALASSHLPILPLGHEIWVAEQHTQKHPKPRFLLHSRLTRPSTHPSFLHPHYSAAERVKNRFTLPVVVRPGTYSTRAPMKNHNTTYFHLAPPSSPQKAPRRKVSFPSTADTKSYPCALSRDRQTALDAIEGLAKMGCALMISVVGKRPSEVSRFPPVCRGWNPELRRIRHARQ